jgi:hypothetical protein
MDGDPFHAPLCDGSKASPRSTSPSTRLDLLSRVRGPDPDEGLSSITNEYFFEVALSLGGSISWYLSYEDSHRTSRISRKLR